MCKLLFLLLLSLPLYALTTVQSLARERVQALTSSSSWQNDKAHPGKARSSAAHNLEVLKRYVQQPDPAFRQGTYETLFAKDGYDVLVIDFVSQNWLTEAEVDVVEWRHHLSFVIPHNRKNLETAFLNIGNGLNSDPAPQDGYPISVAVALQTGAIGIDLRSVPAQPLVFFKDGVPRIEDDILAFAWDQFMKTKDPKWIPRRPMLKAASAAMTMATQVLAAKKIASIKDFVVAGASKRGWTAWLLPLVDQRVKAIVPMVIDILSVHENMKHHHASLGEWSSAIRHYVQHGITSRIDTEDFKDLMAIIDPIYYLDRLTLPKLIVNAANDQFFLPDSSQFYWDRLQGVKHLLYMANNGHPLSSDPEKLHATVAAFFRSTTYGSTMPALEVVGRPRPHQLHLTFTKTPTKLLLWEAVNPKARDFRMMGKDFPRYRARKLPADANHQPLLVEVAQPQKGYKAFFVEAVFATGDSNVSLSTPIYILEASLKR